MAGRCVWPCIPRAEHGAAMRRTTPDLRRPRADGQLPPHPHRAGRQPRHHCHPHLLHGVVHRGLHHRHQRAQLRRGQGRAHQPRRHDRRRPLLRRPGLEVRHLAASRRQPIPAAPRHRPARPTLVRSSLLVPAGWTAARGRSPAGRSSTSSSPTSSSRGPSSSHSRWDLRSCARQRWRHQTCSTREWGGRGTGPLETTRTTGWVCCLSLFTPPRARRSSFTSWPT